jgi:hypothetical protein
MGASPQSRPSLRSRQAHSYIPSYGNTKVHEMRGKITVVVHKKSIERPGLGGACPTEKRLRIWSEPCRTDAGSMNRNIPLSGHIR